MKNPGFAAFAFVEGHPVDMDPEEDLHEDGPEYVKPAGFGRWRTPGQSLRVPLHQGPPFSPGTTPEDVVHGEIISPAEEDGANKIISGEHESPHPSANPAIEHARQELHTPASSETVATLAGLLRGGSPQDVGGMDEAHDYLSRHFTGVRVNPHHGTLEAVSPTGTQLVTRHKHLPAVREHVEDESYSLTNKHGTFQSQDPHRLVRALLAFQIMHNDLAVASRHKKDDDDDDQSKMVSTSGFRDLWDSLKPSNAPGYVPKQKKPKIPRPTKLSEIPDGAVFEPGHGTDMNVRGVRGGYVSMDSDSPSHWRRDADGVAYSPGHLMNEMLDPFKATAPRPDPYHPGHTFTYARSSGTGHTIERHGGGLTYFVSSLHPAARGKFDVPVEPKPLPKVRSPKRGPRHRSSAQSGGELPPVTSAIKVNDLCPVCASGYLEPYDGTFHECLNCSSLVKQAVRRPPRARGGLGRGLGDIQEYQGDPLNLASGGSENPDNAVDLDETFMHPLADEELDPEFEGYVAPRGRLLDKQAGEVEADPLDEQLGKLGYFPLHKPGADQRSYLAPLPGTPGGYARLTEGVPHPQTGERGWVLTADQSLPKEPWTQEGKNYPKKDVPIARRTNGDLGEVKPFNQPLTDLQNRTMAQKSVLATGHHPIDDDALNRAARDLATNGRNSATFQKVLDTAYEPPRLPQGDTQRALRGYSSTNPGISRFADEGSITNQLVDDQVQLFA